MRTCALLAIVLGACGNASRERTHPDQCFRDDDCTLMPSVFTCCQECPPAPPFEAVPVWVVDGMRLEADTACYEHTCFLDPDPCPVVPEGCQVSAVCVNERCRVRSSSCGRSR